MRTNRGTPQAWTQMLVTSEPMSTMASSPSTAASAAAPSIEPTERTMANGVRSRPTGVSLAASTASTICWIICLWATTRSSRSMRCPSRSNSSRM
jgi:hypothetical protein